MRASVLPVQILFVALIVAAPFFAHGQIQRPACTLRAEPSTVRPNEQLTFEWKTGEAMSGTLFGVEISPVDAGTRSFGGYSSEGTRVVTLFVHGAGGSNQCSTQIEVKNESNAPSTFTVRLPAEGTYRIGDDIDISWEYPNASASARVSLTLADLEGNDIASSSIVTGLAATSGYTWEVSDRLGSTTISSGQYRIRAIAYSSTQKELARAESATITLEIGISSVVVQNLANALAALESALVSLISFLGL